MGKIFTTGGKRMFELLTRNWWRVALRGLFAVLFGVATIAWLDATLATLALLFGIFSIGAGGLVRSRANHSPLGV
jgi:uncharacterized membrane protein HdeD (DUF308 family)